MKLCARSLIRPRKDGGADRPRHTNLNSTASLRSFGIGKRKRTKFPCAVEIPQSADLFYAPRAFARCTGLTKWLLDPALQGSDENLMRLVARRAPRWLSTGGDCHSVRGHLGPPGAPSGFILRTPRGCPGRPDNRSLTPRLLGAASAPGPPDCRRRVSARDPRHWHWRPPGEPR